MCGGGESDDPACGPPDSLSLHLASSSITSAGFTHKTIGDNVVRMCVQLKIWCVSCVWMLWRGNSGDGCVLASTMCKHDLRKGNLFVLSWASVRRVTYLVRAANEWGRRAHDFVIASCSKMHRYNRCMYMAHAFSYVCCIVTCMGVCGKVFV